MNQQSISAVKGRSSVFATAFEGWLVACARRWQAWFRHRPQRQLRLCESLPLGEKRFVAVVQFEHYRFLVGGTAASLSLLSQLPNAGSEPRVMEVES